MIILTKFTEYAVYSPHWFIEFIKAEMELRDVPGFTHGKVKAIPVTGDHPLVQVVGSMLNTQSGRNESFAGIIPGISVINQSQVEDALTLGRGFQSMSINQEYIDNIKNDLPDQEERHQEGIITDNQISIIENTLNANPGKTFVGEGHKSHDRSIISISLWSETEAIRGLISAVLKSIIKDMVIEMGRQKDLTDVLPPRFDEGLNNFNFSRVLYGMECELSFLSWSRNIAVTDQIQLDETGTLSVDATYRTLEDEEYVNK